MPKGALRDGSMPLDLRVVEAVVVYPVPPVKEFVVYRVQCTWGDAGKPQKAYYSDHRYSEIRRFHREMRELRCCPTASCAHTRASLPWRMVTHHGNHSVAAIARRRRGLQAYFRSLQGAHLCRKHEGLFNRFLDVTASCILSDGQDGSSTMGLRTEKSYWAHPTDRRNQTYADTGLAVQLFDSCYCTVSSRPGGAGCLLHVTRHAYGGREAGDARASVAAVADMFRQCFTSSAFPSVSVLDRWLQSYRATDAAAAPSSAGVAPAAAAAAAARVRQRGSRGCGQGAKQAARHPLCATLKGHRAPEAAALSAFAQEVWEMPDDEDSVVRVPARLLAFPSVRRVVAERFAEAGGGGGVCAAAATTTAAMAAAASAAMGKKAAEEVCRHVILCLCDSLVFADHQLRVEPPPPPPASPTADQASADTESSCGLSWETGSGGPSPSHSSGSGGSGIASCRVSVPPTAFLSADTQGTPLTEASLLLARRRGGGGRSATQRKQAKPKIRTSLVSVPT